MTNQVYQYTPNMQQDYILLQWLERMRHDGELSKVFSVQNHAPSTFLNFFTTRPLYFQLDSLGNISYACWIEGAMGSVFLSYYAQPAYRKNREVAHFIFDCFDMVFKAGIPVICGLIQQRLTPEETNNFIRLHAKMGYQWRGRLPYFFDGKDCHMVALTKEDWEKPNLRLAKMQERWRKNRESKKAQQEEPVG